MSEEFLGNRRKTLEEAFFANHNKTLLHRLKQTASVQQKKAALAAASGISDDNALEKLVALDIDSDTLAALSLVPILKVAWADGAIDDKERKAALSAACGDWLEQRQCEPCAVRAMDRAAAVGRTLPRMAGIYWRTPGHHGRGRQARAQARHPRPCTKHG